MPFRGGDGTSDVGRKHRSGVRQPIPDGTRAAAADVAARDARGAPVGGGEGAGSARAAGDSVSSVGKLSRRKLRHPATGRAASGADSREGRGES